MLYADPPSIGWCLVTLQQDAPIELGYNSVTLWPDHTLETPKKSFFFEECHSVTSTIRETDGAVLPVSIVPILRSINKQSY